MHLLIDQNIPPRVADELSALGYSVDHVSRVGLAQASDPEIIRFALQRGMTLVTQDLGLALWMPHPHFGLLILRRIPIPRMAASIAETLQDSNTKGISLQNRIVMIEPGRYRVRMR
jgi:predicted nuclease of predicted toxin-antitoxin system